METTHMLVCLVAAGLGSAIAAILAIVPALHVYNVAGAMLLALSASPGSVSSEIVSFFFLGMVTGYALCNVIPSVFLSTPDESTLFVVLPGQKYLMQRRGYEAVLLTGIGGLGGIGTLAALSPFAPAVAPGLYRLLSPHLPWILWTVIAYVLLSEWPKGAGRGSDRWKRWWHGWKGLFAGLTTFVLSGLLGLVLFYRSPLSPRVAFQNLLPAFLGLFAIPCILQNLLSRLEFPSQHIPHSLDITPLGLVQGILSGVLGGLFAAFFPVVTGGVGGLIAGHATSQRDDRLFLIAQGASKATYYVGGFLLFFVPGLHLTRGGMALMTSTIWSAHTPQVYYLAVTAVMLSAIFSFFLLFPLTHLTIGLLASVHYRWISLSTLGLLLLIVAAMTGGSGLLICLVATGIGLIPVLWGSRRMNSLGILLLPIGLNMIGIGSAVARWLQLI